MSYAIRLTTFCLLVIILPASWTLADVPQIINYQGRLTDSGGEALDTTVSIVFTIYDDSTGSGSKWSETHTAVTVTGGLFSVILGTIHEVDDSVFNQPSRYLGITVGTDSEIAPRSRIVSVGYSHRVSTVDGSTGGIISGDVSIQSGLSVSGKATIGAGNTNGTTYSIVAGEDNTASDSGATVLGGLGNDATAVYSIIGGGKNNTAIGDYSVLSGGINNRTNNDYTTVSGGEHNYAFGFHTVIGGGYHHSNLGDAVTISGGYDNYVNGDYSAIGGGFSNTTTGGTAMTISGGYENHAVNDYSAIAGGYNNETEGIAAFVGGGSFNMARGDYSVVVGGGGDNISDSNSASGSYASVLGGKDNYASGDYSSITGGYQNSATYYGSLISGGYHNLADGNYAVVGGGSYNFARGDHSVIAGGGGPYIADSNSTVGEYSVICGGAWNSVTGDYASIGGGFSNLAEIKYSVIAGGYDNRVNDTGATVGGGYNNVVLGKYGCIPGGWANDAYGDYSFAAGFSSSADGPYSFAMGRSASADHDYSFVWSDGNGSTYSDRDDQFKVQAHGGVELDITETSYFDFRYVLGMPSRVLTTSTGAILTSAGVWTDDSKRSKMVNSSEIDRSDLLSKLETLPINRWSHEADDHIKRIGPMADDFHAAFGIGSDDGLAANDVAGVALAAVQELHRKNIELENEINELKALVEKLMAERK